MPGQYGVPPAAFFGAFNHQPMYGGYQPRYTGPFNFGGGGTTQLLSMAAPYLMQLIAPEMKFTQFFPEQSAYDQFMAERDSEERSLATQRAAAADTQQLARVLHGVGRIINRRELSAVERARNERMAETLSGMLPMASRFLGEEFVDQLHGRRGSSAMMAQQLHAALRTHADPFTGRLGVGGAATGDIAQELYGLLYGPGADPARISNLSAGQVGILARELSVRGLLPELRDSQRTRDYIAEMRQSLTARERLFDDAAIERAVLRDKDITDRQAKGLPVSEALLESKREGIRATRARMLTDADLPIEELAKLPGGQDILSHIDTQRLKGRLENLSGAVQAMREVFGDLGNPNAPIAEILNGLDALTQGGLATMSPGQIEAIVRRTQATARVTGMGVQGIMGLGAQAAAGAEQLGVDRRHAGMIANRSALYGAASSRVPGGADPAWSKLSPERVTLLDLQLSTQALGSENANQLAVLRRLVSEQAPFQNQDVRSLLEAMDAGAETFTDAAGTKRSIHMSRNDFTEFLRRSTGMDATQVRTLLDDRSGNQEFMNDTILNFVRKTGQRNEIFGQAGSMIAASFERGLVGDAFQKELGALKPGVDLRGTALSIGNQVARQIIDSGVDTLSDPKRRADAMNRIIRDELAQTFMVIAPTRDPGQLVEKFLQQQGGIDNFRVEVYARLNNNLQSRGYTGVIGAAQLMGKQVHAEAEKRTRLVAAEQAMAEALAPLGDAGPIQRLVESLSAAGPNKDLREILLDVTGAVPKEFAEIAKNQKESPVAGFFSVLQETRQLDAAKPGDLKKIQRNAQIMRALLVGGDDARKLHNEITSAGPLTPADQLLAEQLSRASQEGGAERMQRLKSLLRQSGTDMRDSTRMAEIGGRISGQISREDMPSSREELNTLSTGFVTNTMQQAAAILASPAALDQLGAGGLDLVRRLESLGGDLQGLAREAGDKVTVGDLIAGKRGSEEQQQQAIAKIRQMDKIWADVAKRHTAADVPGSGTNPIKARSEEERRAAEELQRFRSGFRDMTLEEAAKANIDPARFKSLDLDSDGKLTAAEQQAHDVVRRLLDGNTQVGPAERRELATAIRRGDHAAGLDQSLRAREELAKIAHKEGLYGADTAWDAVKAPDKAKAIELLKGKIDRSEIKDAATIERIRALVPEAEKLRDLDHKNLKDRLSQFGSRPDVPTAGDKPIPMTLTGTLKMLQDGTAKLFGEGEIIQTIAKSIGFTM
jgi:hypothetical protein